MPEGFAFDEDATRRIVETVRTVEQQNPQGYGGPGGASPRGMPSFALGKTTTAHSKDSTEDVDLYAGDTKGSEAKTSTTVSAYNRWADLDSGVWVFMIRFGGDAWELLCGDC